MAQTVGSPELRDQALPTPLGLINARWSERGLFACEFVKDGDNRKVTHSGKHKKDALQKQLLDALQNYFVSGIFVWNLDTLDWTGVSGFHRAALEQCFAIPAGLTKTYGELAKQMGNPNAARAVGGAMARNRWPLLIPCHRVLGASGKLTGYSGAGGIASKQWLLDFELATV